MKLPLVLLLSCATLWLCVFPEAVFAQEPVTDTPWTLDEDGLRQWKPHEEECTSCDGSGTAACQRCETERRHYCGECKDTRSAPCRECAGDGERLDPLVRLICPYCDGSALWVCANCSGYCRYRTELLSLRDEMDLILMQMAHVESRECGPCKGTGLLKCQACKGKRYLDVAKAGSGLRKAKTGQLAKARDTLMVSLLAVRSFEPTGNESSDCKTFSRTLGKATRTLPALKGMEKLLEASVKTLRISANYPGYHFWMTEEFETFRDLTVSFYEGQIELLNTCLARLEYNAEVGSKE